MNRIACLSAVVVLLAACNGSHHGSPTDPNNNAPKIANLKAFDFTRSDATHGELPLSFDFTDPDGDVAETRVTFTNGTAANPAQGVNGKTSGTISLLQSEFLTDPNAKTISFTVQIADVRGNLSNVLTGQVNIR
jgi:hypothetical protein